MSNIGGRSILDLSPGTSVTLAIDPTVQHTQARWTIAQTTTLNISGTPVDGQELTLIVLNDGVLPRTLTLGTGLSGIGTIVGTLSKRAILTFLADGGTFYERCRTLGL